MRKITFDAWVLWSFTSECFQNLFVFFELADCVALSLAWSPARGGLTRAGLRILAFAGRVRVELAAGRERVVLGAGAGRARVENFFVRVIECWAKAHELNQLKNRKTLGCTEVASVALRTVGLQQLLHYDVTTHCFETLAQALSMWWESEYFPMLPSYLVKNNSVCQPWASEGGAEGPKTTWICQLLEKKVAFSISRGK